jgi:CheY-like chemotaxis protein
MPRARELGRPIAMPLIEDSPKDAFLAEEALKHRGIEYNLNHVEDGLQAMMFLRGEEPFTEATQLDVMLFDPRMPDMNGHEVLEQIRADESLRRLPVLTTSDDERDINAAYDRNVD